MPSQFQLHAKEYYRITDRRVTIDENLARFRAVLATAAHRREPFRIGHAVQALDRFAARPQVRGLDYGCGDGILVEHLSRRPGWHVVGVDADKALISASRLRFPGIASRLVVHDVLAGPLPFAAGEFDFVFCNSVIQHFDDAEAAHCFRDIHRMLDRGGLLILTFKEGGYLPKPMAVDFGVTPRLLRLFTMDEVNLFARDACLNVSAPSTEAADSYRYMTKDGYTHVTVIFEKSSG